MISEISFRNFQGFGEQREIARLAPLTLIFGPNASGKSSILRGLKLIHQSMTNSQSSELYARSPAMFQFEGPLVSLASYENAVHLHESSNRDIELQVTYPIDRQSRPSELLWTLFKTVSYKWTLATPGTVKRVRISFEAADHKVENDLFFEFESTETDQIKLVEIGGDCSRLRIIAENPALVRNSQRSGVRRFANHEDTVEHEVDLTLTASKSFWEETFYDWTEFVLRGGLPATYGPARIMGLFSTPSTRVLDSTSNANSNWNEPFQIEMRRLQVNVLAEILSAARDICRGIAGNADAVAPLRTISDRMNFQGITDGIQSARQTENRQRLEDTVSKWLEELTDGRYSYKRIRFVAEEVSMFGALESNLIVDNLTNTKVSFQDVGVGLSQIIPILEAIGYPRPRSSSTRLLLIEQPELHLHPKMQAELTDVFIEAVKSGSLQIIAETHSEAMLLRIQRYLRTGKLSPSDISLLYVEPGLSGNVISRIELDSANDFEVNLPISFSGLRLSEYL